MMESLFMAEKISIKNMYVYICILLVGLEPCTKSADNLPYPLLLFISCYSPPRAYKGERSYIDVSFEGT